MFFLIFPHDLKMNKIEPDDMNQNSQLKQLRVKENDHPKKTTVVRNIRLVERVEISYKYLQTLGLASFPENDRRLVILDTAL